MNQPKFRVIITTHWRDTCYGVRQPGCTNRDLLSCRVQHHRWCRNDSTLKAAMNTARIFATYSGLNPQIKDTK